MNFLEGNLTLYIIAGLTLIVIILFVWIARLESRMKKMLRGKNAQSLEDTIGGVIRDLNNLKEYRKESLGYLQAIEDRIQNSVQAVETLRFNPFKGVGEGGNQSFATALVNEKGDGVVISTLHSRDRMSLFAKPVKNFSSEHELTAEEAHVIEKAKNSLGISSKS